MLASLWAVVKVWLLVVHLGRLWVAKWVDDLGGLKGNHGVETMAFLLVATMGASAVVRKVVELAVKTVVEMAGR